jgi:hypothetical protein
MDASSDRQAFIESSARKRENVLIREEAEVQDGPNSGMFHTTILSSKCFKQQFQQFFQTLLTNRAFLLILGLTCSDKFVVS